MRNRLKLLVARIGAFGDVCMLAPLVRGLAREHDVHWLIRDAYAPVIRGFPEIDCRLIGCSPGPDPRQPLPPELVATLRRERYDCLIDCSHWACVGWLAGELADVPIRATTDDPAQDALLAVDRGPLGTTTFNRLVPVAAGEHQVLKWQRLFRDACGLDAGPTWPLPERRPLPATGLTGKTTSLTVFLQADAGKPEKIWPTSRFARVLADLARQRPVHCVINGVRRRHVRSLRWLLWASRVRLSVSPFDPSFATLRDALSQCNLAIGCDSGPMHYAALLGVPTLIIYGRYPAAEFAPRWRSVAVEPPAGNDVDAVSTEAVTTALGALLARLSQPASSPERAA